MLEMLLSSITVVLESNTSKVDSIYNNRCQCGLIFYIRVLIVLIFKIDLQYATRRQGDSYSHVEFSYYDGMIGRLLGAPWVHVYEAALGCICKGRSG